MKRIGMLCLFIAFCVALCACGQTGGGSEPTSDEGHPTGIIENEPSASVEETPAQAVILSQTDEPEAGTPFPFEDGEGRTRYRLVINGTEVETENYPFTLAEEPNGGYYPMEDVLNFLGVACLTNDDYSALVTVINSNIIRVFADSSTLTYGTKTISAVDADTVPVVIDGALYVPSFLLMQLSDNSIVDFSTDRSAATLDTDIVVDVNTSGLVGVDSSILEQSTPSGSGQVVTDGVHRCPECGGAGGYNEQYFNQVMVNGRWQQIPKSRWKSCPVCGGKGTVD
ncbi:MAG: hypothetical protein PHC36_00115 [Eubacteriales bacterium]|nr:hypothetical protein [Eubacteriales bacterium]MDD4444200.1 hypothetical protein [Eubacteriales bacterium]